MAAPTRPVVQPVTTPSPAALRAADRAATAPVDGAAWIQLGVAVAGIGGLAAAIAAVAGQPEWARSLLGLGLGCTAIALGAAGRTRSRRRQANRAAERIAAVVGLGDASSARMHRLVRVRWPIGARRHDPPRRVTVCPPASYALSDPAGLERIAYAAGRGFRIQLRVAAVHRRRHQLVLLPSRLGAIEPPGGPGPRKPREARCAEVVVEQRLGAGAAVVTTSSDTDARGAERLTALEVTFTATADNTEPGFWADFEAAFNRQVPGRWQAIPELVADPETEQVRCRIQRRPTLATRIPYDLDLLGQCGEYDIPYAIDEYGRTVVWPLRYSPNMLLSGATRSGKTSTLRAIVRGFVGRGWPALVCDPKRTGLLGIRGWPGVQMLGTPSNTPDMVAIIDHVHDTMDRRYAAVEAGLTQKGQLEPMLLVLDEYRELQEEIRVWWAREGSVTAGRRRSSEPPTADQVGAIARLGGEVGIHLVVGIKRAGADVEVLPAEVPGNCRCRCSHGALTRDEAQLMWGHPDTGRTVPPMVQGRATAVRSDGTPGEVQALWLPDPLGIDSDEAELYRRVRPTTSPHPWLKPVGSALIETDQQPAAPWAETVGRHRGEPAGGSPCTPTWAPVEDDTDAWELRYGEQEVVAGREVREADLVEVVEDANLWVVVDQVAADPDEPDMLYIDGRVVDTGHPKTIVADQEAPIRRRRQRDD